MFNKLKSCVGKSLPLRAQALPDVVVVVDVVDVDTRDSRHRPHTCHCVPGHVAPELTPDT